MFLARHMALDEFRAIKRIEKQGYQQADLRKEAFILKELRHPGIPIIYDIEEDNKYFYIIEEFLKGESLYALVSKLGFLSRTRVISYGLELCQLIHYLHSIKPTPILYLDLQPKNLLICHDALKLVDFDQAVMLSQADILKRRFGTAGFAAPEQYTDAPLDERADIYAIGALLYYLGTGMLYDRDLDYYPKEWGYRLSAVIRRCLCSGREERYESALQVCQELQKLQVDVFAQITTSPLSIILAGSKPGTGTTHTSLGLSAFLSKKGYPNIYEEKNLSGAANALKEHFQAVPDQCGLLAIADIFIKPYYGENVNLEKAKTTVLIQDFGTDLAAVRDEERKDLVILLCGGKWWDQESTKNALDFFEKEDELLLIFNHFTETAGVKLPHQAGDRDCLRMPYFGNPFCLDEVADDFYQSLFARLLVKLEGKGVIIGQKKDGGFLKKTMKGFLRKKLL